MVRTRFAPSPTGHMHIGNIRTALYAYLVAKHNNGTFILRIEDTDQSRYQEGATQIIYDTLKELGLNWDEGPDIGGDYGPYIQSECKDSYIIYANRLIKEGKAYPCFCGNERLESLKEQAKLNKQPYKYDGFCLGLNEVELAEKKQKHPFCIRFKMPKDEVVSFDDLVYGRVEVASEELEDLIIIKSDGMPTYNFANIIDDSLMAITHVIRGNEYVSSTPKYIQIYKALGFATPEFIHLPLIKKDKDSDKKLSKRDGAATYDALKNKGYLKEAIINMLALTGWSPPTKQEIYTLEELIKVFDPTRIGKSNAVFDEGKLNWLNNHYIRNLNDEDYYDFLIPFISNSYNIEDKDKSWLLEVMNLYKEQLRYGSEITTLVNIFFDNFKPGADAKEFINNELRMNIIKVFGEKVNATEELTDESINIIINEVKEETGAKGKDLFMSIRIATSGVMNGPDLKALIRLMGKAKISENIKDVT